ncbi:hypothetical protein HOLleu_24857 [Holothuria leucospilota]|uniref:Uncharacterized protein n=1 Tax=Holothuria leucospilota TaxID=206669 RepID=A0A9Q1BS56_HOLLE|nr:hypothetical protein HOLleu_24857 [Holothuria leucospilota]
MAGVYNTLKDRPLVFILFQINGTKTFRRINVLQNMTCTNKTFNNFPCTELNIIALNMLSTLASSKLLEDAKDMIKHCNPGFVEDPARTLSAMIKTPTDDEISNVKNFFSSDTVAPQPIHLQPKIQKGPGKVIGIVFLFVVVIASLVITGWLIRTRIFNSHSRTTNFSNVLYSRIDYDHENLDDYSDDDDDKGELSMFERA